MHDHVVIPRAQIIEFFQRRSHPVLVAEDRQVSVHRLSQLAADCAEHLALAVSVEYRLELGAVCIRGAVVDIGGLLGLCVLRGVLAGTPSEDEGIEQRVGSEPIPSVHADACGFSCGVQARHVGHAVDVGLDSSHLIVHPRTYRNRLVRHVRVGEVDSQLANLTELLVDQRFPEVAQVQEDASVHSAPLVDLGLLCTRHHIARGELHHVRGVSFHEALPVGIEQVRAFTAGRLRQEGPVGLQRGRVVLHHLHVHERRSDSIGQGHAVAGADQGVRARLEHSPEPAGRDDYRLGADDVDAPRLHLHDDRADAFAVVHDERKDEPLLIDADAELEYLLVQDMQERLPGKVCDEERSRLALPAERADSQFSLGVSVEYHPHVLHRDDLRPRLAAHYLDGVLVREIVAALHRVVGMVFPCVAPVR